MIWHIPRMWEGGEVWILGGGPSVTQQFDIPEYVVQSVIEGKSPPSVYSPYMKGIHSKHVIGINVSYLIGDWIDIAFFGDSGFFLQHQDRLAAFGGLKVCCHPNVEKHTWIKYLPRNNSKTRGISDNPYSVCWNHNSGAAAISLAVHTGAKRIILVGFDMRLDDKMKQHWHDMYGKIANRSQKKAPVMPFYRHLRGFANIAKDAKSMEVEIINACPNSAIVEFPKCSVKSLLNG